MKFSLRSIDIPDFGLPVARPEIPAATYAERCRRAYAAAKCDWLVIYADREHFGNIAFLTGFEPRFEEALLLLGKGGKAVIVTGNENQDYAAATARLPGVAVVLAQTLSLMGQDRTRQPSLESVLRASGIAAGDRVGLVGWKYVEPEEWAGERPSFFVPGFILDVIELIAGRGSLVDATPVVMHPTEGLASVIDADQIAAFEWASARASAAVWRIQTGARVGDTGYDAVARAGYAGEPLNAHIMLASASADAPVLGLSSPSARRLRYGDGVSTAVSFWGGLACRAGALAVGDAEVMRLAEAYFAGLAEWYAVAAIGANGGDIFARVTETLARGGLRSALNPGHLTGYREWTHSPVRPGSREKIASGMAFQVDIIPVPMPNGRALNCEDPVTFADAALRDELAARHPEVYARIVARRAFVENELGIPLDPSILPLSSTPLCFAPFWLRSDLLFAADRG
jgi:hypothetical protein